MQPSESKNFFTSLLFAIVKKIRIVEELPKSSVKGVLIGLVEIKGTAETKNEILQKTSPL